jgi:hypothetical protein
MLLKSSDFVSHDLTPESVFENCDLDAEEKEQSTYELELVLRKWYPVNPSREVRCFVRKGRLIGEPPCHFQGKDEMLSIVQRESNIATRYEPL